jgi:hypothetical protein
MNPAEQYQALAAQLDPEGWKLLRAAEKVLGKFDYAHFAYEDSIGTFEEMDGFGLLEYLYVQNAWKLGEVNARQSRFEPVASCYEQCVNMHIDKTTPEFKAIYEEILHEALRNMQIDEEVR